MGKKWTLFVDVFVHMKQQVVLPLVPLAQEVIIYMIRVILVYLVMEGNIGLQAVVQVVNLALLLVLVIITNQLRVRLLEIEYVYHVLLLVLVVHLNQWHVRRLLIVFVLAPVKLAR